MNKSNKIREAEVQLENREHYKPLEAPMVNMTQTKVNQIIDKLHRGKYIDDMTKKWLAITPSPPRIPVFYTLTKEIHKGIHPRLQNSPTSRRKPFNIPILPRATLRG